MKKAIIIDENKCTGCRICEMICSFGTIPGERFNPAESRIRILKNEEAGIDLPVLCFHCEKPSCVDACPVEAICIDENQIVQIDESLCSGCKICMDACPYAAIRERGDQIIKCDLCKGDPLCVKWCPTNAIQYVETDSSVIEENRNRVQSIIIGLRK